MNNKEIYPLVSHKPIVIPVTSNKPVIVATDGFHYTRPLKFSYDQPSYYRLKITCAIDDLQLLGGAFVLVLSYLLGFFTGIFLIKLFSFLPLAGFLIIYYINRKDFLRLRPAH